MAYQPMKSKDGWFVIDDETGEPVNDEPLKSKAEALKLVRVMEMGQQAAPAAMKSGPPRSGMPMDMPMQGGMGMPPNMPNSMAGSAPSPEMLKELMRKKAGAIPGPMAR